MKFTIFLFLIATMVATINAGRIARQQQKTEMQLNFLQQKMARMIMRRKHFANKLFF